jgi:hypothetical protein
VHDTTRGPRYRRMLATSLYPSRIGLRTCCEVNEAGASRDAGWRAGRPRYYLVFPLSDRGESATPSGVGIGRVGSNPGSSRLGSATNRAKFCDPFGIGCGEPIVDFDCLKDAGWRAGRPRYYFSCLHSSAVDANSGEAPVNSEAVEG